jgi:hypothetical protein
MNSRCAMAQQDFDAKTRPQLPVKKEQGIAVVNDPTRANFVCQRRLRPNAAALPDLILDEPLAPLATPVHLTEARFTDLFSRPNCTTLEFPPVR